MTAPGWNVKTDAAVVANGRDYGAELDQGTPTAVKVFLIVTGVAVVLIAACFLVWAFSPFDTSPAPVSLSPDPGRPIPAFSLMQRAHSARIAS
jgi:hypothetical protein